MNTEQLEVIERLARRAAACKHWQWRVGMAAIAATDKARLFLPNCDLPIRGEYGVRLLSHVYSEARYAFSEDEVVRRSHLKAYAAMITEDGRATDNEDDGSKCWAIGFTHLEHLMPDFHDTVTMRGLLQIVRSAWDAPTLSTNYSEYADGRCVWSLSLPMLQSAGSGFTMRSHILIESDSEIGVLVAALEKAP
jgi:hypothetical protein